MHSIANGNDWEKDVLYEIKPQSETPKIDFIDESSQLIFEEKEHTLDKNKIIYQSDNYTIKGINISSKHIFKEKKHAVLGISPQNGYYTKEKIYNLIKWANYYFEQVVILPGEGASYYNFLSRGYSEKRAHEKCKEQDRLIGNRILNALEDLNLKEKIKILKEKDLFENPIYLKHHQKYTKLLEKDEDFRNYLKKTIHLLKCINNRPILDWKIATQYFLYELPVLLNSPSIFQVKSSCFIYHNVEGLFQFFYDRNDQESQQACVELYIKTESAFCDIGTIFFQ